jgi:hypothetical protein
MSRSGLELFFSFCFWFVVNIGTLICAVGVFIPFFGEVSWKTHDMLLWFFSILAVSMGAFVLQIGIGAVRWVRYYRETEATDWAAKYAAVEGQPDVKRWTDVVHFVVVPNYKEPEPLMQLMMYALITQRTRELCKDQVVVVLAMEEREGASARSRSQNLQREFSRYFREIKDCYHPPGLPGEIPGKASNYKWAVKCIQEWVQGGSYGAMEDVLVHVADSDSLYHPNYFAAVTYSFCTLPDRYNCVWQPCMTPTCNFWEVPAMCRLTNLMVTAQEMMSAVDPLEFQIPFSTWGLPLKTLKYIGDGDAAAAPDGDVIADDHHLFVKGYFKTGGLLRTQPVYLPCLNFSVGDDKSKSYLGNLFARYTQAKRHMFGIAEFIFLCETFFRERWCCSGWCSSDRGCTGRLRTVNFFWKMTKIHGVTIAGLWVPIGGVLLGVIHVWLYWCKEQTIPHAECVQKANEELLSSAAIAYSTASAFTVVGSFFVIAGFVRMLWSTHSLLLGIADPVGPFSSPSLFEQERAWRRRPINVATGFPWIGSCLQLWLEFIVWGLFTSLFFASLPTFIAVNRILFCGHTMTYVVAPKPTSESAGLQALTQSMVSSARGTPRTSDVDACGLSQPLRGSGSQNIRGSAV